MLAQHFAIKVLELMVYEGFPQNVVGGHEYAILTAMAFIEEMSRAIAMVNQRGAADEPFEFDANRQQKGSEKQSAIYSGLGVECGFQRLVLWLHTFAVLLQ